MAVADQIVHLVKRKPGLTEAELADKLFPGAAYQQRVNSTCRRLIKAGQVMRCGLGGAADPYRYHIPGARDA